jgi:hypothetical protein
MGIVSRFLASTKRTPNFPSQFHHSNVPISPPEHRNASG